jgi:hypothetical protein
VTAGSAGSPSCTPYLCDGTDTACPATCSDDNDCIALGYCNGTTCFDKQNDGAACSDDEQCLSDKCIDGYCCDTLCGDDCDACNVMGSLGICSPSPDGSPGSPACAVYLCDGASTSCATSCAADADCVSPLLCSDTECKSWWDGDWKRRRKLTFDNASQAQALSGFPVLVKLDNMRIDYGQTQNNGEDIRFVDAITDTVLPHEIEQWNEAGASYVWVSVPTIDALSNTDYIWMYYGNSMAADGQMANAVWDSGYRAVWHMAENPAASDILDSTANANGAVPQGMMMMDDLVSGQAGLAIDYDGVDDYLNVCTDNCAASVALTTNAYTLEALVRVPMAGINEDKSVIDKRDLGNDERYMMAVMPGGVTLDDLNCRANTDVTGYQRTQVESVPRGVWTYIVCRYDGNLVSGNVQPWVDGVHQVAGDVDHTGALLHTTDDDLVLGKRYNARYYEGESDELRISSVARSDSYIQAQALSLMDTFVSFAAEETR